MASILGFFLTLATLGSAHGLGWSHPPAGSGQSSFRDHQGYRYDIFFPEETPELQALIDSSTEKIFKTKIGLEICQHILQNKAENLEFFAGVSRPAAVQIVQNCWRSQTGQPPSYVIPAESSGPRKITLVPSHGRRLYAVLITDNPSVPFDSWTESYTNRTILVLPRSQSETSEIDFTQILAHELAIYFDAKSWPGGPGWWAAPDLKKRVLVGPSQQMAFIRAQNPLIAQVLGFIRAFKIEKMIIDELTQIENWPHRETGYLMQVYPFLASTCLTECLKSYILSNSNWLLPHLRFLLAMAPTYRAGVLRESRRKGVPDQDLVNVLERFPQDLLNELDLAFTYTNFFNSRSPTALDSQKIRLTEKVLYDRLLPIDLEEVAVTRLVADKKAFAINLLTYQAEPLLGSQNSLVVSGPRPRIRGGGTR